MLRHYFGVLACALALILFTGPAFAQEADTMVNLWPLIDRGLGVVVAIIGLVATYVIPHLSYKWLGIRMEEKHAGALQGALMQGVNYAADVARSHGKDLALVDVKHQMAADAVRYVAQATPDALAHFGITSNRVEEMVRARLEERFGEPSLILIPGETAGDPA
jgi:hypothetical protein